MSEYHMRRQDRKINDETELNEILEGGKYAVISMCRDNEPYIVSLSYGYDKAQNSLYFHCALEGTKIDFIKQNPNVCATIIDDRGYKNGECAHEFRSVVMFGNMVIIESLQEKKHAMEVLLNHLEDQPDKVKERTLPNENAYARFGVLKLEITEVSGKKGR